ncbi:MAG: DNA alkylation repair protein [Paludibacter sp.]|nr:DNA alkylation repair protein [Paludibacter sp.]
MKYTLINPKIEAQITEIQSKIRLSMNGIVSDQMTRNGILYKKNYGVSIPRIKEIASMYPQNHELAQRLWNLQIRETMILATLLEQVDTFNIDMAKQMAVSFNQIEIIEQACMNLFCKLPFANKLCSELIHSETTWMQITGYILAARIIGKLEISEINEIILQALLVSNTENLHLYKAVALCLSRFCRKGKETAAYILKEITAFPQTTSISQQYISTEVKQEILFLDIL